MSLWAIRYVRTSGLASVRTYTAIKRKAPYSAQCSSALGEPLTLCSPLAESVIVGYYAFLRKRVLVRLYACTDNLNQLRIFIGLLHFSVAFAAMVSCFATPLPGIAGCTETVHPYEGRREMRLPGDYR